MMKSRSFDSIAPSQRSSAHRDPVNVIGHRAFTIVVGAMAIR